MHSASLGKNIADSFQRQKSGERAGSRDMNAMAERAAKTTEKDGIDVAKQTLIDEAISGVKTDRLARRLSLLHLTKRLAARCAEPEVACAPRRLPNLGRKYEFLASLHAASAFCGRLQTVRNWVSNKESGRSTKSRRARSTG